MAHRHRKYGFEFIHEQCLPICVCLIRSYPKPLSSEFHFAALDLTISSNTVTTPSLSPDPELDSTTAPLDPPPEVPSMGGRPTPGDFFLSSAPLLDAHPDDPYEGPSSVEAQADSNDLDLSNPSLDLDLDAMIPEPSFPLNEHPSGGVVGEGLAVDPDFVPYFPSFLPQSHTHDELKDSLWDNNEDVPSDSSRPGLVGLRNVGNTCFLNSGLQCLLASAPVVEYFAEFFTPQNNVREKEDCPKSLSTDFSDLLKQVWQGEFQMIKPQVFKDALAEIHPQFKGTQQHDCQEFLALLLDTLHEELRASRAACQVLNHASECGTSMELHTSHSQDKPENTEWSSGSVDRPHHHHHHHHHNHHHHHHPSHHHHHYHRHRDIGHGGTKAKRSTCTPVVLESELDGNESRESGSPKSFDSHSSSIDDKVGASIRQMPIPHSLKVNKAPGTLGLITSSSSSSFSSSSSTSSSTTSQTIPEEPMAVEIAQGDHPAEEDLDDGDEDQSLEIDDNMDGFQQPTSNLVAPDSLKRPSVTFSAMASMAGTTKTMIMTTTTTNNQLPTGISIDDYMKKDNKTLNVNVLAETNEDMNNEINFDSEKFSRHHEKLRPKETIENLNLSETHSFDKKIHGKRFKATNLTNQSVVLDSSSSVTTPNLVQEGTIKRMRLDSNEKEKNVQLERQRQQQHHDHHHYLHNPARSCSDGDELEDIDDDDDDDDDRDMGDDMGGASALPLSHHPTLDPSRLKEAIEADRFWEKHLAVNDTVVARTFQGQFKNTVICSSCSYVSVNFEPFMYLPVPLPDAHIRQVQVHFKGGLRYPGDRSLLLDMTQADDVGHLKSKVAKYLIDSDDKDSKSCDMLNALSQKLNVVEVLGHHISRNLEDWCALRHLKEDRDIYVIEPLNHEDFPKTHSNEQNDHEQMDDQDDAITSTSSMDTTSDADKATQDEQPVVTSTEYQSCVICMDDLPPDQVRQHNVCNFVLCNPCIERSVEHHDGESDVPKGHIKCPGCRENVDPEQEFVSPNQLGKSKPKLRMFTLPVVMRQVDNEGGVRLFGQPSQLHTSNQVKARDLHQWMAPIVKPIPEGQAGEFDLVIVDVTGKSCGRCIFSTHCRGCIRIRRDSDEEVILQSNDTIAVSYRDVSVEILATLYQVVQDKSLQRERMQSNLSLEQCLKAFSESETLDENNPWFCPICQKNQCATKTLSVWRLPDFLIIYLKRFVFMNHTQGAVKLEKAVQFNVNDLDLTPHLSGPLQSDSPPHYDLYACVNHFGSVGGGHYTAFCKHLKNREWNYFDDFNVTENKQPGDNPLDESSAYILFYERRGASDNYHIPCPVTKDPSLTTSPDRNGGANLDIEEDTTKDEHGGMVGMKSESNNQANQGAITNDLIDLQSNPGGWSTSSEQIVPQPAL
eukprot:TCALIF_11390-PA protein Name:"Similar to USP4 Ubiquitin carboxyl-terminal hydrolase 4 (Bos taurus)" AED:0.25 eAED:0.27 QI:0/0/0/0.75/1/1/4/0/1396